MEKIIITTKEELEAIIVKTVQKALQELPKESKDHQNEFLDVSEACSFLKLARQTIYGLTSRRLIPFIKRGKKVYFRSEERRVGKECRL